MTDTETSPTFTLPLAEPGPILPATATPSPNLAWRKVPTEDALNFAKLRGLGRSKKQRIIDMLPTMGDFEKQRGLAVKANRHFAAMLPKGVGEDVADELENRAIAWLAKWHDENGPNGAKIRSGEELPAPMASGVKDAPPATEPVITASDTATETPTDAVGLSDSNVLDDFPAELASADTTISRAPPLPTTIVESPTESPLASGESGVCIGGFHEPTDPIDELFGIHENT